jgi:CRISPR-associated protein Cas1
MKRQYFVFSHGRLVRHQNTIYLQAFGGERMDGDAPSLDEADSELDGFLAHNAADGVGAMPAGLLQLEMERRAVMSKKPIPVEDVDSIFVFGEMEFNTRFFNFAARHHVPIHFFNYYGYYSGSFMPRQEVNSGKLLVQQTSHYISSRHRLILARAFVEGASFNILKNLKYYGSASRGRDMTPFLARIEAERAKIADAPDISGVMGLEGAMRAAYYQAWPLILSPTWAEFTKRVKRPPDNPVNALISFCNSLCYTLCLSEVYRTPLSPLISFLHEPGARRYSLCLDLSEIFKPILCDRMIFKLINNGEIRPEHFESSLNFCTLKESGRKIVLEAWYERLQKTIKHRNLGRNVSYRRLVRLECYALERHMLGMSDYEPFKIWW